MAKESTKPPFVSTTLGYFTVTVLASLLVGVLLKIDDEVRAKKREVPPSTVTPPAAVVAPAAMAQSDQQEKKKEHRGKSKNTFPRRRDKSMTQEENQKPADLDAEATETESEPRDGVVSTPAGSSDASNFPNTERIEPTPSVAHWPPPLVLVTQYKPEYPRLAWDARIGGTVKVSIGVAADGSVHDVQGMGNPILLDAVKNVIRKWRYEPNPGSEGKLIWEDRSFTFKRYPDPF